MFFERGRKALRGGFTTKRMESTVVVQLCINLPKPSILTTASPTAGRRWETANPSKYTLLDLANCLAQCGNGLSRREAYRKLVVVSAADYRSFAGILSDPNNPFGVHKDFHAVHIFKHDKVHVRLLLVIPT